MPFVSRLVARQVAMLEQQGDRKEAEIRQLQATNDYLRACRTDLALLTPLPGRPLTCTCSAA
jgi:hypothetical protein